MLTVRYEGVGKARRARAWVSWTVSVGSCRVAFVKSWLFRSIFVALVIGLPRYLSR